MRSGNRIIAGLARQSWRFRPSSAAVGAGVALALEPFHSHLSTAATTPAEASAPLVPQSKTAGPAPLVPALSDKYDYDVVVIGGGSGGLSCSREVAALHGKVALFDYVNSSPQGTKWGIGGTCVNVGCIPKKIMHQAALLGQGLHDAQEYGWEMPAAGTIKHNWQTLAANAQDYIRGTNWGYRNALRDERIEYINAQASVVDGHTVEYKDRRAGVKRITAAHIVIAVGGRPRYPDNVPGAKEFGITSDDLFWLPHAPGKTLLVGGGYVALECAGFLNEIGCPATVMVRGPSLRGFDQQMAEKIVGYMAATGVRFLRDSSPLRVERVEEGGKPRVRVVWSVKDNVSGASMEQEEVFDTVMFATGRAPETGRLGLAEAAVAMDSSGKIVGGLGALGVNTSGVATSASIQTPTTKGEAPGAHPTDDPARAQRKKGGATPGATRSLVHSIWSETTSIPSIHAVGDVLAGRPELTPVAIRAGKLLAGRIMRGLIPTDPSPAAVAGIDPLQAPARNSNASRLVMDYGLVPTTVFTPLEYGCVGLSEEEATVLHSKEEVEVYHLQYDTLELAVSHRKGKDGVPLPPQCYAKMICVRTGGKGGGMRAERVVGLHVLGPSAGEVIQGFAVALRMGASREDIMTTVGIHPTHAEELVSLERNKKDGGSAIKTSC